MKTTRKSQPVSILTFLIGIALVAKNYGRSDTVQQAGSTHGDWLMIGQILIVVSVLMALLSKARN